MAERTTSYLAANRFGLGARPDEAAVIAEPKQWLLDQLRENALPSVLKKRPATATIVRELRSGNSGNKNERRRMARRQMRATAIDEAAAGLRAAAETPAPFVERLVFFWANHFSVSAKNPFTTAFVPNYQREAIRPKLNSRFADLLLSAVSHPAMLLYLDNAQSIGPASRAGRRRRRGLNENLAREILELHTLGVDGGYRQDDVIALAGILTGWTVNVRGERADGSFQFRSAMHEPGKKRLLGRVYGEGLAEGQRALRDIALHPATARHIARKIAAHFISDAPPKNAVARIEKTFSATGGDLQAVFRTLLECEESWSPKLQKLKTPQELLISTLRAAPSRISSEQMLQALTLLGQVPYQAPSPKGYPDTADAWLGPEAMMNRIEFCHAYASRLPVSRSPLAVLEHALGPLAGKRTRTAVARAASAEEGLALVLLSPEFQRR